MKRDKSMFIVYQYIDANYTKNYLARSITYVTRMYQYIILPFPIVLICRLIKQERVRRSRVVDTDFSCHFHSRRERPRLKRKESLERTLRLYTRTRRVPFHPNVRIGTMVFYPSDDLGTTSGNSREVSPWVIGAADFEI